MKEMKFMVNEIYLPKFAAPTFDRDCHFVLYILYGTPYFIECNEKIHSEKENMKILLVLRSISFCHNPRNNPYQNII